MPEDAQILPQEQTGREGPRIRGGGNTRGHFFNGQERQGGHKGNFFP